MDNVHIGDIKEGRNTARVKKLLESGSIQNIYAEVSGGDYKKLKYLAGNDRYELDEYSTEFAISIEITYREAIEEKAGK